jgi:hypothetical protein
MLMDIKIISSTVFPIKNIEYISITPSYTNKQHSNKQFLNKQYSKLQQNLPIVSTCKLPNLEFGLKFWHQILPIYLNDDFNNFA